jgi:hypothetical protein
MSWNQHHNYLPTINPSGRLGPNAQLLYQRLVCRGPEFAAIRSMELGDKLETDWDFRGKSV